MRNINTDVPKGAFMSRVIGGSASKEAYTRMLEELKQKNAEKQAQQYAQSERIRTYNDDAAYRQASRKRSVESVDQDNQRMNRQNSRTGNYYDAYA